MSADRQARRYPAGAGRRGFRAQLGATAASAAGPYGYTISLGGSSVVAVERLGAPALGEALLLMVGAVLAFLALELAAVSQPGERQGTPERDVPPSVWGNAHFVSAGAAICGGWLVAHAAGGAAAWLLVGFVTTAVYFALTALQRIAVVAAQRRRRRRPSGPARSGGGS